MTKLSPGSVEKAQRITELLSGSQGGMLDGGVVARSTTGAMMQAVVVT